MNSLTFDYTGANVLVTGGHRRDRQRDRPRVRQSRCRRDDHRHP